MKLKFKISFMIILGLLIVLICSGKVFAAASSSISASNSSPKPGDTVVFTITVNADTAILFGTDVKVSFDTSVFTYVSSKDTFDGGEASISGNTAHFVTAVGSGTKSISVGTISLKIKSNLADKTKGTVSITKADYSDSDYNTFSASLGSSTITVSNPPVNNNTTNNTTTNNNTNTNKNNTTSTNNNTSANNTTTTPTKSSDATLKSLTTSPSGISPKFSASTLKYALTVDSTVTKVTVSATVNNSKATYKVSGNTNLQTGTNLIKVVVTAENGTTKTYQITVTKKAASDVDNNVIPTTPPDNNVVIGNNTIVPPSPSTLGLSSLAIEGIDELSPVFSTNTYYYVGNLQSWADSVNVTAIANQDGATVDITGNTNLIEGDNSIVITVKSKDGKETKSYTVTLNNPIETDENSVITNSNVISDGDNNNNTNSFLSMIKDNISMIILGLTALIVMIIIVIIITKLAQGQSDHKYEVPRDMSYNSKKGKRHKGKGE